MASVKYSLDTRRARKDGTYPLLIRLSVKDKTLPIKTAHRFLASDWDSKKSCVKRSYKGTASVKRLNIMLEDVLVQYKKKLEALEESGKLYQLSIQEVRDHLTKKVNDAKSVSFDSFTNELITQMKEVGQLGNAQIYLDTVSSVENFMEQKGNQKQKLFFADLTYQWLTQYETYYLAKGNTINGLGVRMRTIRAIYNKAIKHGGLGATKAKYPFEHYSIKVAETKRRALHRNDLQTLLNYAPETSSEQLAMDVFQISFYLRGMNFIDLAYMRMSQIKDKKLFYTRQKTKKSFILQIPNAILPVFQRYCSQKVENDFVLPIITKTDPDAIRREVKNKLIAINKTLKSIAAKLGLEETNITSYVARHSYATQAKKKGVPIAAISDMLGHKSMATTETYLHSFSNEALDEWSEVVFGKEVSDL